MADATPSASSPPFRLRLVSSGEAARVGQEFPVLTRGVIGRDRESAVMVADPSVSRRHASVEPVATGIRVVDLSSGNGVWIGTTRVTDVVVEAGGQFRVGGNVFECVGTIVAEPIVVVPAPAENAPTAVLHVPAVPSPAAQTGAMVLRVIEGGDDDQVGHEFALGDEAVTIGREADCTIVLAERDVSRRHARVVRTPEGHRLTDLGSTCGVWMGGLEVSSALLKPGDQFRLGNRVMIECRLAVAAGAVAPAPAEDHATRFFTADEVERAIARSRPAAPAHSASPQSAHPAAASVTPSAAEPPAPPRAAQSDETNFITAEAVARALGATSAPPPAASAVAPPAAPSDETNFITAEAVARALETPSSPAAAAKAPSASADADATNFISADDVARALASPPPGPAAASPAARTPSVPASSPAPAVSADPNATNFISAADVAKALKGTGAAAASPSVQPAPPAVTAPARRIEDEGTPLDVDGHQPIVLSDPDSVWYVVAGGVLLFTVALEDGEPVGTRAHFLGVEPGQAFFGFDLARYGSGSGFLAVPRQGTKLRKIPLARLKQLGADPAQRDAVAAVVDGWVTALSAALIANLPVKRTGEVTLAPGPSQELDSKTKVTSASGVLWLGIGSGGVVFNDMATPIFTERSLLFPLTPQSWIRPVGDEFGTLTVKPVLTGAVVATPALWQGLAVFHQILCECEFVTKKLSTVDEYVRLQQKEQQSQAARQAAYGAIGSVLNSVGATPQEFLSQGDSEPVLRACEYVGHALGIDVKPHPSAEEGLTYEQQVTAISTASGFRTRVVALRDRWHHEDNGAMLGQIAETKQPVALLPSGPTHYDCVDPSTGARRRIDDAFAATLSSFAYAFYRPFPDGKVSVLDVIKFGGRGMRGDLRWVMFLAIVVGMFGTVTPYITGQVFDSAIPQADRSALVEFGIALFISALATSAFKFTQGVATIRIQARMGAAIQAAVWDRILNLPVNFFRKYSAGDLADRAEGVEAIQELVSGAGVAAILGSVSGLFYVVQMFGYNTSLAMLAVVLTIGFVGFNMGANYLQLRYQRVEFQLRGRISGLVLNLLTGVTKLRVSGAEQHAFRVWAEQFAKQRRISFTVGTIQNLSALFGSVFPILSSIMIFATMLAIQQGDHNLTTGDFIAFNAAYGLFLGAMQALGDASLSLLRVVPIYERLEPILITPPETDRSKAFPGKLKGEIELSHVFFRYDADGPWIVKDMSLKIAAGEFVAFVGSSGGGKSTVLRLLLGFEQPTRGAVLYDGQDLNSLDLRMVRQQIGVVLQASRVMPTEIFRNIAGVTTRSIEEAWEAAEKSGLAEDIRNMPMGMHTYVSEGGGTLSGGQRQRLMIARAIVNKPKILFLDEATSALDNKTQNIVTESMDKMDATRIVIAHRLSTVVNAHRICYLDSGTIAEVGTYQELMDRNGMFAQLARRQMA